MKKLIMVTIVLLSLVSCDSEEVKKNIAVTTATALTAGLECNNYDAVYKDISYLFGVVSKGITSVEIDADVNKSKACEAIVAGIIHLALDKGVPKAWECSMTNANAAIDTISAYACEKFMEKNLL